MSYDLSVGFCVTLNIFRHSFGLVQDMGDSVRALVWTSL